MAPQIPVAFQARLLGERAEIAVFGLERDEVVDELAGELLEFCIAGQAQSLDGGDEIFSRKFPGPGNELGNGLAVAQAEHFQHSRIGDGRGQEPVGGVRGHALSRHPFEAKLRLRQRVKHQFSGVLAVD